MVPLVFSYLIASILNPFSYLCVIYILHPWKTSCIILNTTQEDWIYVILYRKLHQFQTYKWNLNNTNKENLNQNLKFRQKYTMIPNFFGTKFK